MEDVAAADSIARDHRDHGLWQPPDLHLEVEDVEARHAVGADVAALAADRLVAAAAEGEVAGAWGRTAGCVNLRRVCGGGACGCGQLYFQVRGTGSGVRGSSRKSRRSRAASVRPSHPSG